MKYYNLLMIYDSSKLGALDNETVTLSFHTSRFLEYTDNDIRSHFQFLSIEKLNKLKNFPCILTFELFEKYICFGKAEEILLDSKTQIINIKFKKFTPLIDYENYKNYINDIEAYLQVSKLESYRTHWALKEVDLTTALKRIKPFEKLNIENLIESLNFTNEYFRTENSLAKLIGYDISHPSIKSLSEFIEKIIILKQESLDENYPECFFRGHSNYGYRLEPSIFRLDQITNRQKWLENEDVLFRELQISEPMEFNLDKSALEVLTRMQHYSMPTRLLDVTSNPLTALYFACESLSTDDGEVILIFPNKHKIKYYDSDTVSCLSNISKLTRNEKDQLANFLTSNPLTKKLNYKYQSSKKLINFIKEEKIYFTQKLVPLDLKKILLVKGKRSNSRISAQSGAFILFGLDAVMNEVGDDNFLIKRIRIPSSMKEKILKELDLININLKTIYPTLENTAKYLKDKCK